MKLIALKSKRIFLQTVRNSIQLKFQNFEIFFQNTPLKNWKTLVKKPLKVQVPS